MLRKVTAMGRSRGRKDRGERWIQHYSSSHKILLVGEGDFSFSASLAKAFGSATNMVATSYDSKEMLRNKHWSSEEHLEELKGLGCMVLHDIDVHVMNQHWTLKTMKFDRIVYNFPHAGHDPLLHERNWRLIGRHKKLLSGFFQSAREMLTNEGEVHVSHRNDDPYDLWNLEKLARRTGLVLKECVEFRKADYPGYLNKRGGGIRSNQKFPLKECFTFKFSLVECSCMQGYGTLSNHDDIEEALPKAISELSNKEQKAKVETFGKRIMPSEGNVDQLKKKIDKPDSTTTKDMIERVSDQEPVHKQIVNIPHTVNGLKSTVQEPELVPLNERIESVTDLEIVHKQVVDIPDTVNRQKSTVQDQRMFQGTPSYPPAKETETRRSQKMMSEEEGKSRGISREPQHHHQHYRMFEGAPSHAQPEIGFPVSTPHRDQVVQGYVAVAEGRPIRECRRRCCGIGLGWFLFIIAFFLAALVCWSFYYSSRQRRLARETRVCRMHMQSLLFWLPGDWKKQVSEKACKFNPRIQKIIGVF